MQSAGLLSAMENVLTRYRNTTILVAVLFVQIIALAVQVKRPVEGGSTRLIRYWVVSAITPLERGAVGASRALRHLWSDYLYLRGVRDENRALREQIDRMRIEEVRLKQDADQARRLQALLAFKEQFISQTVAAQVIGSSGSDQSRVFYLDKGSDDGLQPDMAVITPDGIVGKVLRVYRSSSQVLEMSDQSSGVGAILEKSRLQGILNGSASGELFLKYIMSDEKVEPGERVLTSGGDRIFPKGLPIGTVRAASPGSDLFLNIRVRPAADLSRLEEVLVITRVVDQEPAMPQPEGPVRAADILAQRLPTVEKKAPAVQPTPSPAGAPAPVTRTPLAPKPRDPQPDSTPQAQVQTEAAPR
jgi:rod shape-determining protein MreC